MSEKRRDYVRLIPFLGASERASIVIAEIGAKHGRTALLYGSYFGLVDNFNAGSSGERAQAILVEEYNEKLHDFLAVYLERYGNQGFSDLLDMEGAPQALLEVFDLSKVEEMRRNLNMQQDLNLDPNLFFQNFLMEFQELSPDVLEKIWTDIIKFLPFVLWDGRPQNGGPGQAPPSKG